MSKSVYDESHIKELNDLEAIRRSAFMYLSTTPTYKLICEIIQNSNDEAGAGRCSCVSVKYDSSDCSIRVIDDGFGIPLGKLELVVTKLNAGGKFEQQSGESPYKRSFGKHGIGLKACNAVSELFEIWSRRDGKEKYLRFSRGIKQDEKETPYNGKSGTEVFLIPDKELLQDTYLNKSILLDTLELLAYLTPGFRIDFQYDNDKYTFLVTDGGIDNFFRFYIRKHNVKMFASEGIVIHMVEDKWELNACFMYSNSGSDSNIGSFTNGFPTRNGGSHVTGVKKGVSRAITQYMKKYNSIPKKYENLNVSGTIINDYLAGVIVLYHDEPYYDGQVKDRLMLPNIENPIASVAYEAFLRWAEDNKKEMDKLIDFCIKLAKAEWEAKNAKAKVMNAATVKSTFAADANLSKFTDTNMRNPEKDECYFVEGDSAAGTLIQARDANYQAIMRLRGKLTNVNSDNTFKLSSELEAIVTLMECGIGEKKDIRKLRFNKLIVLADADDDGAHITALLLGFFHKYYPELIMNGNIYVAKPPLKRLIINKTGQKLDILNQRYNDFYLNELTRYTLYLKNMSNDYVIPDKVYEKFVYGLFEYGILLENINAQLGLEPDLLEYIVLNYDKLIKNDYKPFEKEGYKVKSVKSNNGGKAFEFDKEIYHYYVNIDKNFYHNIYKPLYVCLAEKVYLKSVYFESKTTKQVYKGSLYYYSAMLRSLFESSRELTIRRYKGLGEMNKEELRETVTNPETRTLVQVTMEDAEECARQVEIFLGKTMLEEKKAYFENM